MSHQPQPNADAVKQRSGRWVDDVAASAEYQPTHTAHEHQSNPFAPGLSLSKPRVEDETTSTTNSTPPPVGAARESTDGSEETAVGNGHDRSDTDPVKSTADDEQSFGSVEQRMEEGWPARHATVPTAKIEAIRAAETDGHRNVYIAWLPRQYSDEELMALSAKYGRVENCRVVHRKDRAYGFALFETAATAAAAALGLCKESIQGRRLQAHISTKGLPLPGSTQSAPAPHPAAAFSGLAPPQPVPLYPRQPTHGALYTPHQPTAEQLLQVAGQQVIGWPQMMQPAAPLMPGLQPGDPVTAMAVILDQLRTLQQLQQLHQLQELQRRLQQEMATTELLLGLSQQPSRMHPLLGTLPAPNWQQLPMLRQPSNVMSTLNLFGPGAFTGNSAHQLAAAPAAQIDLSQLLPVQWPGTLTAQEVCYAPPRFN